MRSASCLAALNDSEVADNTIVIYCTDHGENKGDHGLWWKNNMYEHASRTPLIVVLSKTLGRWTTADGRVFAGGSGADHRGDRRGGTLGRLGRRIAAQLSGRRK